MKLTTFLNNHYEEFPQICALLGFKPITESTATVKADQRITMLAINFYKKHYAYAIQRCDNGYYEDFSKHPYQSRETLLSALWNNSNAKVLRSPKIKSVLILTPRYYAKINGIVKFCEMNNIPVRVKVAHHGHFDSSTELTEFAKEEATYEEEWKTSVECAKLIAEHARELMPYLKKGNDVLAEVIRQYIKSSGYDVSMESLYTTDCLNHGKIDDSKGIREWSRNYTKHKEWNAQNMIDLINMYINCKWYEQAGFEKDSPVLEDDELTENIMVEQEQVDLYKFYKLAHEKYGVNFSTAKAYCTIYNMDRTADEVVVVPVSACGAYTKMKLN